MGRTVLEEAATPEFPRFAKALPGNPHDSSPSGTIAYRQPCRDRGRLKTSHACTDGTLLQLSFDRNKKVRFNCAETVDDADCLWKLSEKMEITWDRVGRTFLSDDRTGTVWVGHSCPTELGDVILHSYRARRLSSSPSASRSACPFIARGEQCGVAYAALKPLHPLTWMSS